MVVPLGEHLWSPQGTHITDPTTGMSIVAQEDTTVTFESEAAHQNAMYCAEEQRRLREYSEAAQQQALQQVHPHQDVFKAIWDKFAELQLQISDLRSIVGKCLVA